MHIISTESVGQFKSHAYYANKTSNKQPITYIMTNRQSDIQCWKQQFDLF